MLSAIGNTLSLNGSVFIEYPILSKIGTIGLSVMKALSSVSTIEKSTFLKGAAVCLSAASGAALFTLNPGVSNSNSNSSLVCTASKAYLQFNMCPALVEYPWSSKPCSILEAPPEDTPLEKKIREINREFDRREKARKEKEGVDEAENIRIREENKRKLEKIYLEHEIERNASRELSEEIDEMMRRTFSPTPEEMAQKIKEAEEAGSKEFEKLFETFHQSHQGLLPIPPDCQFVDPIAFKNLTIFEKISHPSFNPLCPEHAKIILTHQGKDFDQQAYKDRGCTYIKTDLSRSLFLATHPDKNPSKDAADAFQAVQTASAVLCELAGKTPG